MNIIEKYVTKIPILKRNERWGTFVIEKLKKMIIVLGAIYSILWSLGYLLFFMYITANDIYVHYMMPMNSNELYVGKNYGSLWADTKEGFFNGRGQFVIKPKYDSVEEFDGYGLAKVYTGDKGHRTYSLINKKGEVVTRKKYDDIPDHGWGAYITRLNNVYELINGKGEVLTRKKYTSMKFCGNGMFRAKIDNSFELINEIGVVVTHKKYDDISYCGEDVFIAKKGNVYDVLNKKGECINVLQGVELMSGCEGLILYKENGKYGYLKPDGTVAIKAQFLEKFYLYNEITSVKLAEDKYALINKKGEILYTHTYKNVDQNEKCFAAIFEKKMDSDMGAYFSGITADEIIYFKSNGQILKHIRGNFVYGENGYTRTAVNGKLGLLDPEGNLVIPIRYTSIRYLGGNVYAVKEGSVKQEEERLINTEGKYIAEGYFLNAYWVGDGKISYNRKEHFLIDVFSIDITEMIDINGKKTPRFKIYHKEILEKEGELYRDAVIQSRYYNKNGQKIWDVDEVGFVNYSERYFWLLFSVFWIYVVINPEWRKSVICIDTISKDK